MRGTANLKKVSYHIWMTDVYIFLRSLALETLMTNELVMNRITSA